MCFCLLFIMLLEAAAHARSIAHGMIKNDLEGGEDTLYKNGKYMIRIAFKSESLHQVQMMNETDMAPRTIFESHFQGHRSLHSPCQAVFDKAAAALKAMNQFVHSIQQNEGHITAVKSREIAKRDQRM